VVTAFADSHTERAAFAAGAFDFVPKLVHTGPKFLDSVERASEHRKRQLSDLERLVATVTGGEALNGYLTKRLFAAICDAAAHSDPVAIVGGSACLRYAVARAIHEASAIRRLPFVARDCGAIPAAALRADLFEPQEAQSSQSLLGSVFLDDIDRLSPDLQAALLNRLSAANLKGGGRSSNGRAFRVIAGSIAPLEEAVHVGRFSEDLYCHFVEICISHSLHRTNDLPAFQNQ
jgi:two-component system, NtrC family, C4-dicarboxylate transport response regulator DctD